MNPRMFGTPCIVCHQKGNTYLSSKLHRMIQMLQAKYPHPTDALSLIWHINIKCQYGLYCPDLTRTESELNQLSFEINRYLYSVVEARDTDMYHQSLQYLRGDFPEVYTQLERAWAKANNAKEESK